MGFLSKLLKMFSEDGAEEPKKPEAAEEPALKEPEVGLDEEMLSSGASLEPQNGEGGLEGLFNVPEEDKGEKLEQGKEESAPKEGGEQEPSFAPPSPDASEGRGEDTDGEEKKE